MFVLPFTASCEDVCVSFHRAWREMFVRNGARDVCAERGERCRTMKHEKNNTVYRSVEICEPHGRHIIR